MLAAYISIGVIGWLIIGCLVTAISVALKFEDITDPDKAGDVALTLCLWPLALAMLLVMTLGEIAVFVGLKLRR